MMHLGISSYSYGPYMEKTGNGYFEACDHAKATGFDAIEFTTLELKYGRGQSSPEELARALKAHCDGLGLAICAYTVSADFLSGSNGDMAKEVERLKGCVDVAVLLGARVMRHDVAWKLAKGCKSYRDVIRMAAPAVRELTEYAASKGVRTCTENHGYLMQDAHRVEEMILAVGHENYGWLVDMGNFACADEDSVQAVGIAAPYAFHVHAKDFLKKPGTQMDPGLGGWLRSRGGNYLRGTVPGHGDIPIAQCVYALRRVGYDGFLSLEFEGMEETLPAIEAGYAYLRRVLAE
jgi:sugar phosphate isomerase/epimerase